MKDQFGNFEASKEDFKKSLKKSRIHVIRAGVIGFGGMAVLSAILFMLLGKTSKRRMDKLEILHYENALLHAKDRRQMLMEGKIHELPPDDVRIIQDLEILKQMEEEIQKKKP